MLCNLYQAEVIKTLLRGPLMGFPWGTLNPDITAWVLWSSFQVLSRLKSDLSRVTELIITVGV